MTPPSHLDNPHSHIPLPKVSKFFWDWFKWYCRGYMPKTFRAVRLVHGPYPEIPANEPLIGFMNHPSWWDPLLGMMIAEHCFGDRTHYGAMDADALKKYWYFEKLGFFGVERGSARGAVKFLKQAQAICAQPGAALWLTPHGRYADARERPAQLLSGLAHAVAKLDRGWCVPIAIEYPFWDATRPEALGHVGVPLSIAEHPGKSTAWWQAALSERMGESQDHLAKLAMARDPGPFLTLVGKG